MMQTREHLERVDRAGTRGASNRVDETLTARCHAVVSSPAVEALSAICAETEARAVAVKSGLRRGVSVIENVVDKR